MISLFTIAPSDLSMSYLGSIFGTMGGILPATGQTTMLSTMFATFNAVVLAVGAMIVVYMTVVGAMATAHEGEFMGKKWNNIWIPIRTVLGIATLVPTASGYSAIQIVFMWIIIQGIGAADSLWTTTLAARSILGSPTAQVTLPDAGVETAFTALFQGLMCDATSRLTYANPMPGGKGGYYCQSHSCSAPAAYDPDVSTYQLGPNGSCGTITHCVEAVDCKTPSSMKCYACKAQTLAMQSIIPALSAVAAEFAEADYKYRDFYYNSFNQPDNPNWQGVYDYCQNANPAIPKEACCNAAVVGEGMTCQGNTTFPNVNNGDVGNNYQSPSDAAVTSIYWPYMLKSSIQLDSGTFMSSSVSEYMGYMDTGLGDYMKTAGTDDNAIASANIIGIPAGPIFEVANQVGWVFAGAAYYSIATEGKGQSCANALPDLKVDIGPISTNLNQFRTNVDATDALVTAAGSAATSGTSGTMVNGLNSNMDMAKASNGMPKIIKPLLKPVLSIFKTLNKGLMTLMQAVGGPLNALQAFGQLMILTGEVLYVGMVLVSAVVGTATFINVYALGTGADNPLWGTLVMVMLFLAPVIYALIAWLIGFGGVLAVYLPLVPYIIFLVGVIGWFIAVFEAMIAAPLVALGILSPSGQHELLGKAEPAILMMFNIFLRPSLMIFGMIGAMLLVNVVVLMIINTFFFVTVTITHGVGLVDPVVMILFVTAFITLVVSAMNKCFQMIYVVPAQVMQWIGGSHHTPGGAGGESEALGESKSAISGRAQAAGGSAKTASGMRGDYKEAKDKKAAQSSGEATPTITPSKKM